MLLSFIIHPLIQSKKKIWLVELFEHDLIFKHFFSILERYLALSETIPRRWHDGSRQTDPKDDIHGCVLVRRVRRDRTMYSQGAGRRARIPISMYQKNCRGEAGTWHAGSGEVNERMAYDNDNGSIPISIGSNYLSWRRDYLYFIFISLFL